MAILNIDKKSVEQRKDLFLTVLEKNAGMIKPTCRDLGINPSTVYRWMKADLEYAEEIELIREGTLDAAEECLQKAIEKGDINAAMFVLRHRGASRGYIGNGHNQLNVNVNTNENIIIEGIDIDSDIQEIDIIDEENNKEE